MLPVSHAVVTEMVIVCVCVSLGACHAWVLQSWVFTTVNNAKSAKICFVQKKKKISDEEVIQKSSCHWNYDRQRIGPFSVMLRMNQWKAAQSCSKDGPQLLKRKTGSPKNSWWRTVMMELWKTEMLMSLQVSWVKEDLQTLLSAEEEAQRELNGAMFDRKVSYSVSQLLTAVQQQQKKKNWQEDQMSIDQHTKDQNC